MVTPIRISLPMDSETVISLKAGDVVSLSGMIVTGRDKIHRFLVEQKPPKTSIPFDLYGAVLYHCGPVIKKTDEGYKVVAAGPTTSIRVEMYEPDVIREYGIRGIMGKGGMGEKTRLALKEQGCVYFHAIGGAAVYLADRITRVAGVWKLEDFGTAEAMWGFEVDDFPAIVTMDATGNDIHKEIERLSAIKLAELTGIPP